MRVRFSITVIRRLYNFRTGVGWAEPGGGTGAVNYWYDGSGTGIGTDGSVGVGTTNPQTTLQVGETYGVTSSGVLSFTAQAGIAFTANSFNINTNNFRTAEYTFHFTYNNSIQSNKTASDAHWCWWNSIFSRVCNYV